VAAQVEITVDLGAVPRAVAGDCYAVSVRADRKQKLKNFMLNPTILPVAMYRLSVPYLRRMPLR
jgi:hypothetical protein